MALDKFLGPWYGDPRVVGILVCGSFVTGNANDHSDIDVHIVMDDQQDWREHGNRVVDGFLIEYFINPIRQIKAYFEEDYRDLRPMSMVQFITGEVLFPQDLKGIPARYTKSVEDGIQAFGRATTR